MELNKKILNESFERSFSIVQGSIDKEARTVEVAFSSEIEVERWFGLEVLDHSPESVRLERLRNGGAVLMDHNRSDQVGVVKRVSIDSDRVGRAMLRFGKSARAEEMFNDVIDEIRVHISVGYHIHKYEIEERAGAPDLIRVTDWEPIEISFVSIPADPSVGVGRSLSNEEEGSQMGDKVKTEAAREESVQTEKTVEVKQEARAADVAAPAIHVNAEQVRADEQARISSISEIARSAPYDLKSLEERAIKENWNAEKFKAEAFEQVRNMPQVQTPASSFEGMSRESGREFSLWRAIQAQHSGDWTDAGFEREVSQELARSYNGMKGGLLIPMDALVGQRSDTTTGAGLIGTQHMSGRFIDTLRATTQLGGLGAQVLDGLNGNLSIPKKTGNSTFGFLAEGANAADSDVPVGNVALSGKHIGGRVPITFEMLRNSSPAIEQIVRSDMLEGIALSIDAAGFNGSGAANNPRGILNTVGLATITAADTVGKVPTWAEILEMEGTLDEANALFGSLAYVFRPTINQALKGAKKDAGSGEFVISGGMTNGYKAVSTTQVPALTSIFGNFNDVLIGSWGVVEVVPERNTQTGGLDLGIHHMMDIAVRNAESFVKIV